jgi:hypothetical protein
VYWQLTGVTIGVVVDAVVVVVASLNFNKKNIFNFFHSFVKNN